MRFDELEVRDEDQNCYEAEHLILQRTSRIRRRRAQDVADRTDSLRAVACIRFVRHWLVNVVSAVMSYDALSCEIPILEAGLIETLFKSLWAILPRKLPLGRGNGKQPKEPSGHTLSIHGLKERAKRVGL